MVTPKTVYDYDMDSRGKTLLKQQEVPNYDPKQYTSERLMATASDGAKIPISLVYKKTVKMDGSAPLLLKGYGAYGYSYSINFDPTGLVLLDHLRAGDS